MKNLFDLTGKVALVTGGGGLLGPKHAEAIVEYGGSVILADWHEDRALKKASEINEKYGNDKAIGVFMDGTRQLDGRCNNPLAGAALLAARSGSHLLPVAILNSHRALGIRSIFPRLVPIHLRIGSPIPPPMSRKKIDLEHKTAELKIKINSMLDQGNIK